jgi:hypothetical protein
MQIRKIYLLLLLVSGFSSAIAAEGGAQSFTTGVPIGGGIGFPHFTPQASVGIPNTHFRLIAKTYLGYSGSYFQPIDSTFYSYGAGRGSLINPDQPYKDENILFDDAITYYYNAGASGYQNRLYRNQLFDDKDRIKTLKYARWDFLSLSWKDSSRYLYSYVAGTNRIDQSTFQLWVGGTWSHNLSSTLLYSGTNVVTINSLDYSASYTYDTNNNIISIEDKVATSHGSGTLNNNELKTYIYNANNEVTNYTLSKWDATKNAWIKSKHWDYTYTTGSIVTKAVEYNWNGTSWDTYCNHTYTYNANNDQTSELIQLWDAGISAYVNSSLETRVYNSYKLLESISIQYWDNTNLSWHFIDAQSTQTRYYYEFYNATEVNKVAYNNNGNLFPNPATDIVHVQIAWNTIAESNICLYNSLGVPVYTSHQNTSGNIDQSLDIHALPAGTYTLIASNGTEQYTNKLLVIR